MKSPSTIYFCISISLLLAWSAQAQGFKLEGAGARGGFQADSRFEFHQAEAFVDWALPWALALGKHWNLRSGLDASAGWLGDSKLSGGIAAVGPTLTLTHKSFPLFVEGGSSPTALTRSEFTDKDFGINFGFTSHIGLGWDVTAHWRLAYRFQHMSNAGLASSNPGLNLHMFALSYQF